MFSKLKKMYLEGKAARTNLTPEQAAYRNALQEAPAALVAGRALRSAVLPTTVKGAVSTALVAGGGAALTLTNIVPLTTVLIAGIPILLVSNTILQNEGELQELYNRARKSKRAERDMDALIGLKPKPHQQEHLSVSDLMDLAARSSD